MKRDHLLVLLHNYKPTTDEDAQARERIDAFVRAHPDCFERTLEVGHITASAWLLNKEGAGALLLHHAKLNIWVQPGGHCDGESDVLAVAIKEAQEESGIQHIVPVSTEIFDLDVHFIPARKHEKEHYHYDVRFLLQVASEEEIVRNHESRDMRWFDMNKEGLPTASPSVTRMFDKWIAGLYTLDMQKRRSHDHCL